jgi:hypothetical protein
LYIEEVSGDPNDIKHASEAGSGLARAWESGESVKRRRIVNVGSRLFLDFLNCESLSFGDDAKQLAVDLNRIGVQPTKFVEHNEQAGACGVHGIEFSSDEKFTCALAVHAAPSRLKLLLRNCERMVWINDGDVGAGHTRDFIQLLSNFRLESRGCCGLVEDFLPRYFDSSTVVLLKESARVT